MNIRRILPLLLAAALQVMPMLRAILPAAQSFAPSSWAIVLKLAGGAVALLGSYHAVSAATAIIGPYAVNGTNGVKYVRQLGTSVQTAHSWSASTDVRTAAVFPLTPGLYLTNATGKIGGYPTRPTTSNIIITAWEFAGNVGNSTSASFAFAVVDATGPPGISIQPLSQAVAEKNTANFSVAAYGLPPLRFQWRFKGVDMADATNSTLSIPTLTTNNAGAYTVFISNSLGSTTSTAANLTVWARPVFTSPPAPAAQTVFVGNPITLTVSATGAFPLGFRWRKNGGTVTNFVLNSSTCILNIPSATLNDAGTYTVVVTNIGYVSPGVLSDPATVTVLSPVPVDTDGDGMTDDWELAHGLNPNDPADALLDLDGDGMSNLNEFISGTDPQDSTSYLKINQLTAQPGVVSLQFLAISNRAYVVESNDSSLAAGWQAITNIAAAPTNRLITATDPAVPHDQRFYRLVIP